VEPGLRHCSNSVTTLQVYRCDETVPAQLSSEV
jgi:hypothetical protein